MSVGIIVNDSSHTRDAADDLVYLFLVYSVRRAIENKHLSILDLIVNELTHIAVVRDKGVRIGEHHVLINSPIFREIIVKPLQEPHSVVFYYNSVYLLTLGIRKQIFLRYHILGVDSFDSYVFAPELRRLKLLNSFFAKQDESLLAAVEILIGERFLNYRGLAALKKSCKQIYGNFHFYTPNKAAMASSLILDPITQSLPIGSGLPSLTSGSPGT